MTVYGNVELDKGERAFLLLGPDFALLQDIDMKDVKVDFLTALMKIRCYRKIKRIRICVEITN